LAEAKSMLLQRKRSIISEDTSRFVLSKSQFLSKLTTIKAEYFIAPASVMAISFIKFSIVAFYRRIFTVKLFMNISLVVGVICVLWMITGMIGNLLYCIPMESFWDKAIEGKCFNFDNWFLAMETIDLLLDAIILALPIKTIMGLQLSAHKKTTLLTIFLLGGL